MITNLLSQDPKRAPDLCCKFDVDQGIPGNIPARRGYSEDPGNRVIKGRTR